MQDILDNWPCDNNFDRRRKEYNLKCVDIIKELIKCGDSVRISQIFARISPMQEPWDTYAELKTRLDSILQNAYSCK
jgi:hypothetical protein